VYAFFSISGYLIPFLLERYSHRNFLIKRTLRIFPTAVTGLIIILAFYYFSSTEESSKFDMKSLAMNFLLLAEFTQGPFIDGVF